MKTGTSSFWIDKKYKPVNKLQENLETDVIIIGGGMTGISTAYQLQKKKVEFLLVEGGVIGYGSTGKSSGALVPGIELDFYGTVRRFGEEKTRFLWDATLKNINDMKNVIKEQEIKCSLSDVRAFCIAEKRKHLKGLEHEKTLTGKYSIRGTLLDYENLKQELNIGESIYGGLIYDNYAAVMDPFSLVTNLASKIENKALFENSRVNNIDKSNGKFVVKTDNGSVSGKRLILATEYMTEELGHLNNIVHPIKAYTMVTERLNEDLLNNINFNYQKVVWDYGEIYHFIRMTPDNRILICGGDSIEHQKDDSVNYKSFNALRKHLHKVFPQLKDVKINYRWAGILSRTIGGLPVIGYSKNDKNLLYSAGYGGHGLPMGFLGGRMMSEICSNSVSEDTKMLLEAFKVPRKSSIRAGVESKFVSPYISWLKLRG